MENQADQGLPDAAEDETPQEMTDIQVRILGCLMEKKETVPDQYPLTLNALRNACNQKDCPPAGHQLHRGRYRAYAA